MPTLSKQQKANLRALVRYHDALARVYKKRQAVREKHEKWIETLEKILDGENKS